MNSTRYREQVLEGVLLDFWTQQTDSDPEMRFHQDGAPSHTSKATRCWLADHDIHLFPHPPSSPDLSPIENVWHILKARIRQRDHIPSSIEELETGPLG